MGHARRNASSAPANRAAGRPSLVASVATSAMVPGRVEALSDSETDNNDLPRTKRDRSPKPSKVRKEHMVPKRPRPDRVMELSDSDADSEKTVKLNGKQQLVCDYSKFKKLERNATLRPFVEVFAGSCHLSHAFNDAGHPNYSFDVKLDEAHNMITEKGLDLARLKIHELKAAAGGTLPYIHFAPPCSTYSQARYPKIRSTSNPQGLPANQLTQHDKNILKHANKITANTFKLMTELTQQGFPVSIEQPASSLMLRLKSFKGWAAQSGASPVLVDYCQFGMAYRKRTVLWTSPAGFLAGLERRCPGLSDDHQHQSSLSGWDKNKDRRLATSLGCSAYPGRLCREWVRVFNTVRF